MIVGTLNAEHVAMLLSVMAGMQVAGLVLLLYVLHMLHSHDERS